jgi:hypothetical protein
MSSAPSNHRQAERMLIRLVRDGRWTIDEGGRIWKRSGSRAEKPLTSGYMMVRAMIGGKRVCGLAHRLVWQHFSGDIADGLVINHRNGKKYDNRPCNLEVVTYSENMKHARRVLGVASQKGQLNPASKLTPGDVAEIRAARQRGEKMLPNEAPEIVIGVGPDGRIEITAVAHDPVMAGAASTRWFERVLRIIEGTHEVAGQ